MLGDGGGSGTRAVAAYDEDATTMAVEAARIALRSRPLVAGIITPAPAGYWPIREGDAE